MTQFRVRDKETGKVFVVREKQSAEQAEPKEEKPTLFDRAVNVGIAGPGGVTAKTTEGENILPAVGATAGAFLGSRVGRPNMGAGAGTAVGDLAKQTIKKLQGDVEKIDVGDAVILGGLAAAGGKLFEAGLKSAGVSMKIIPERARVRLYKKALQAVNIGRKALSRNFGRAINRLMTENPTARIDLSNVVTRLGQQIDTLDDALVPQLKSAINKNPKLKAVVENSELSKNLTLAEAQELKNAITSTVKPIIKRSTKGQTTTNETVVLDILDSFDDTIAAKFPQMREVRKAYRQGRDDFNLEQIKL